MVEHNVLSGDQLHNPKAHASSHTSGADDIQDASTSQKGLMTTTQATALGNAVSASSTIGDNKLIRGDGGSRGAQETGIEVDDTDAVAGAGIQANAQTGTTYTLALSDAGKLVTLNNGSAITLTIPANSSIAFEVGTVINLLQLGAGTVSVAITSDTLQSKDSNTDLGGQYAAATLVKIASTTWVLFGDLA